MLHLAESPCGGATGSNIAAHVLLYLKLSEAAETVTSQKQEENKQIHFLLKPLNAELICLCPSVTKGTEEN